MHTHFYFLFISCIAFLIVLSCLQLFSKPDKTKRYSFLSDNDVKGYVPEPKKQYKYIKRTTLTNPSCVKFCQKQKNRYA